MLLFMETMMEVSRERVGAEGVEVRVGLRSMEF